MARLIDADERITEIKKQYCTDCENYGGVKCRACWVDDAVCLIDDATTVDAVPVVRCRDCKHLMFSDCYGECGKGHMSIVSPDDFCSYGERKDGDWNE